MFSSTISSWNAKPAGWQFSFASTHCLFSSGERGGEASTAHAIYRCCQAGQKSSSHRHPWHEATPGDHPSAGSHSWGECRGRVQRSSVRKRWVHCFCRQWVGTHGPKLAHSVIIFGKWGNRKFEGWPPIITQFQNALLKEDNTLNVGYLYDLIGLLLSFNELVEKWDENRRLQKKYFFNFKVGFTSVQCNVIYHTA